MQQGLPKDDDEQFSQIEKPRLKDAALS